MGHKKIRICGVYQIVNLINGKSYVGSSIDCDKRWQQHRIDMNSGKHCARHMVAAWKKYGASNFEFRVLEEVSATAALLCREQFWLDALKTYDASIGYNTMVTAGSPLGTKRSAETRAKISAVQKGRKMSEEQKAKISAFHLGRKKGPGHGKNISRAQMLFKDEKLDELLRLRRDGMGVVALAAHFGCDRYTIRRTLCGRQTAIGKEIDPIERGSRPTGRFTRGHATHNKKLGVKQLAEIGELRGRRVPWKEICAAYGVNMTRTIKTFKGWQNAQQI